MKKIMLTLSLFTFLVAASTTTYATFNNSTSVETVKGEKDKEKAKTKKKKATTESKKATTEKSNKSKKGCSHTCTGKKTS